MTAVAAKRERWTHLQISIKSERTADEGKRDGKHVKERKAGTVYTEPGSREALT